MFSIVYSQLVKGLDNTLIYIVICYDITFQTDTASVLHEAIEYIKFLHDQIRVSSHILSSSFLNNINLTQVFAI